MINEAFLEMQIANAVNCDVLGKKESTAEEKHGVGWAGREDPGMTELIDLSDPGRHYGYNTKNVNSVMTE